MTDTLVIFGCGFSLHNLSDKQWDELKQYDTMGFNWFLFQEWIKPKYMLVGDIRPAKKIAKMGHTIQESYDRYDEYVRAHEDRYKATDFIVREAQLQYLKTDRLKNIVLKNNLDWETVLKDHVFHGVSGLLSSLNFAIKKGYRKILFAGVDMYDNRYFFLDKDQVREHGTPEENPKWAYRKVNDPHPIHRKVLKWFNEFGSVVISSGVKMYSYNPKSLILRYDGIRPWEAS